MKHTKRKGFNFFRSYYDVFNELPEKDKLPFIEALLDRQFLGIKPTNLKGMSKFAWISQVNSIDSQVKGYEDKTGVKLTPTEGGLITPTLQVEEKEKEKVQVKEKGERKAEFKNSLTPFLETYEKELLNDFYSYWTEHGENDRKMRFEKEKSFGLSRRLATWKKREIQFNKTNSNGTTKSRKQRFIDSFEG